MTRSNSMLVPFLAVLLLVVPLSAGAQQAQKVYRIGYLALTQGEEVAPYMKAFRDRLRELGYLEGKNLVFDYRSAEGREDRLAALATELSQAKPDVLVGGFGTLAPLALKRVTTTIPIVFANVGDPVGPGLVTNLAHPGGNITGMTSQASGVAAKRLQLLQALVPGLQSVAILMNPATPFSQLALTEIRAAAKVLSIHLEVFELRTGEQASSTFAAAVKAGSGAMIVLEDPLTYGIRQQITDLAAKYRLPAIYGFRDIVEAGGLMSYGPDRRERFRRAADYVDKILKGTKPGDLPVEQPTKLDLVLNAKTAEVLRLAIPQALVLQADQIVK